MARRQVAGWAWLAAVMVAWLTFGNPEARPDEVSRNNNSYQRYRVGSTPHGNWSSHGDRFRAPHHGRQMRPRGEYSTEGSWFQRPYPYHLDYYRMRYKGSYEPYFGNLYGPPIVVMPPVFGGNSGGWYW